MSYTTTNVPAGERIAKTPERLIVPDRPIIPFIRGDGTGPDIWKASQLVFDAAVDKAYGGRRKIAWMEVFAGETAFARFHNWLPEETLTAFREFLVGIKGPLTTPVGGGIRSLNVALRQHLDLYVCLRPVRYFAGVPSPVKRPEKTDMVIFRENSEDIYAGIEWPAGSAESQQVLDFLAREFPAELQKVRFGSPERVREWQRALERAGAPRRAVEGPGGLGVRVGLGLKPASYLATERLVHSAISHAIRHGRKSVTLVHKGNIMKYTEGAFRDWGYKVAREFFGAQDYQGGPWQVIRVAKSGPRAGAGPVVGSESGAGVPAGPGLEIIVKDVIADAFLQQILTRPEEYDVIATLNLNGDYVSDALAACVGGIGIAPGGNINYLSGHAIFEATHGTAPKYAGQDKVNPGSVILSGEMMLRYMGWDEAADLIVSGMEGAIRAKRVTYDFARFMEGATEVKCSEFGREVVAKMA